MSKPKFILLKLHIKKAGLLCLSIKTSRLLWVSSDLVFLLDLCVIVCYLSKLIIHIFHILHFNVFNIFNIFINITILDGCITFFLLSAGFVRINETLNNPIVLRVLWLRWCFLIVFIYSSLRQNVVRLI